MPYRYFSPKTDPKLFFCQETGDEGIDPEFVHALDLLREECGFPFIINSGYRSPLHSIEVAKDQPGEHTRGAADIAVHHGYERYKIIKHATAMGFTGIGVHKGYIHLDKRITTPVCWPY